MQFCSCRDQVDSDQMRLYVLLFSTMMYLKENLMSSTLLILHSICVCLRRPEVTPSLLFCLHFLCFFWRPREPTVETICKECIIRSGFPETPYVQRMRGICLKMISEPCTFMLCDCEILTFVTQKWKLFSNGDLFCVFQNLGAMFPGKS